jgi:hypothetical protein
MVAVGYDASPFCGKTDATGTQRKAGCHLSVPRSKDVASQDSGEKGTSGAGRSGLPTPGFTPVVSRIK